MTAEDVLVVEDDPDVRALLVTALERAGFATTALPDGTAALEHLESTTPDLVVLDLGLPDVDGLDLLARIRARWEVPVIVVTGRDDEADRVAGLDVGADDYVTKPFSPRELVSRVRAVLRRTTPVTPEAPLVFGGLVIDATRREARLHGEVVAFTRREFELLLHLARHPNRVFSKGELLAAVWQSSPEWQDPETVTEHVRRIRRKVEEDPARPTRIVTLRGVGYRFEG